MGGNFQCAKNKFFAAVNNLMNEEAKSPTSDHDIPVGMSIKDIIAFVDQICKENFQEVRDFCTRPSTPNEASLICYKPTRSHIDNMQSESGKEIMEGIDYSDPESHAKVQGIICAVLSDIISALLVCEELLGNYVAHAALTAAENRLQKVLFQLVISKVQRSDLTSILLSQMLYGEKVMRTAISLCSIDHCMDGMQSQSIDCSDLDHGLGADLGIGGLTPPKVTILPTTGTAATTACTTQEEVQGYLENENAMKVCLMSPMNFFTFSSASCDDHNGGFSGVVDEHQEDDMGIGFFADFE